MEMCAALVHVCMDEPVSALPLNIGLLFVTCVWCLCLPVPGFWGGMDELLLFFLLH